MYMLMYGDYHRAIAYEIAYANDILVFISSFTAWAESRRAAHRHQSV